jgi:hypothetical protein
MGTGKIDLEGMTLPLTPEVEKTLDRAAKGGAIGTKQQHGGFTKFPDSWANRLRSARGVTYRAALFILRQYWKTNGQPVRLSNTGMASEGVGRHSKWRALQELERAGLIRVEKRPRKSPIITILVE